jgi:hypothetical protein
MRGGAAKRAEHAVRDVSGDVADFDGLLRAALLSVQTIA